MYSRFTFDYDTSFCSYSHFLPFLRGPPNDSKATPPQPPSYPNSPPCVEDHQRFCSFRTVLEFPDGTRRLLGLVRVVEGAVS